MTIRFDKSSNAIPVAQIPPPPAVPPGIHSVDRPGQPPPAGRRRRLAGLAARWPYALLGLGLAVTVLWVAVLVWLAVLLAERLLM